MRMFAAALALLLWPAAAAAAPTEPARVQPQAATQPAAGVRIAMRQETLPPGGRLAEHRPEGERYLYVISGQLKVSDLVTGDEQIVEAGKMAAERSGDWHTAEAVGPEAATFYLIDRAPAAAGEVVGGN